MWNMKDLSKTPFTRYGQCYSFCRQEDNKTNGKIILAMNGVLIIRLYSSSCSETEWHTHSGWDWNCLAYLFWAKLCEIDYVLILTEILQDYLRTYLEREFVRLSVYLLGLRLCILDFCRGWCGWSWSSRWGEIPDSWCLMDRWENPAPSY
jgi:hypothetical protein